LEPLFITNQNSFDYPLQVPASTQIHDILKVPGTRLIMPSEESEDLIYRLPANSEFNRLRPRGGGRNEKPHEFIGTTYGRVFVNTEAEPFMTSEKLRFPVGSVIVREKLLRESDVAPNGLSVMIKRERRFSPKTNDWEFFVIDQNLNRIVKRETTGSCMTCHANMRETDYLYKSYLK